MQFLLKITLSAVVLSALTVGAFTVVPQAKYVYAETIDELRLRMSLLLAQVANLQAQVASFRAQSMQTFGGQTATSLRASAELPSTFRFTRNLQVGSRGADVRYLQILLNRDLETRVTLPGSETDHFGPATKAGVIRFQNKYAANVLRPAGLRAGTGSVGALTRNKLNALLMLQAVADAPVPQVTIQNVQLPTAPMPPVIVTLSPPAPTVATPPVPIQWDEVNTKTRNALVNILCTTKRSGSFNPLSGSGVMIDKRGVVLTNAHVAEFFLLKDYLTPDFIECLVRTGEPARNAYRAKLLYISPLWIGDNYRKITEAEPTGTGEDDFALLLITGATDPSKALPSEFPALEMDQSDQSIQSPSQVLAASYPAGFLGGINIQKDLYPVSVIAETGRTFGFNDATPDLFSIGGSALAQHGSSGGAVVSGAGRIIGLIVTSTDAAATADRDLRAITMSHIARSFKKDTGRELDMLFQGDLAESANSFNQNVAPTLTKLLESAILAR